VRPREFQRWHRKDVVWCLLGVGLVQLALAVGIDQFWPAIRDPEYDDLERMVRSSQAAAPGRPLVLAFGSSRTKLALNAGLLNNPTDASAPLVLNCAALGSGPLRNGIVMTRMLRAGIRPQYVFIEIIPMALSIRDGAPIEERLLPAERVTAPEAMHLWRNFSEPYRLLYPWLRARTLPVRFHNAELRQALKVDLPAGARSRHELARDNFGWGGQATTAFSHEQMKQSTDIALAGYSAALRQPDLAPGTLRALAEILELCEREHIPATIVVPPEGALFRSFAPAVAQVHMDAIRSLASGFGVPLIDARAWVDDDGFFDGHHTLGRGANQFTERFRREVLEPTLSAIPRGTSASAAARGSH
jgi:hypothetical protein